MKKIGIFLSRMQPIHNAHLWMIENALKENDEVLIIIGSANKSNYLRNPLDISLRTELVEEALKEKFGESYNKKIKILQLADWSTEQINDDTEWGRLIYYSVVGKTGVREFSYYCAEEPAKIKGWFEEEIQSRINFRFFSRENEFNGLSATKVRTAILEDNLEFIKEYCPSIIVKRKEELKEIIKLAKTIE